MSAAESDAPTRVTARATGRWSSLLLAARRRREPLHERPDLDAYRLLHGAGEGAPGWNVDRYADVAVITHPAPAGDDAALGDAMAALAGLLVEGLGDEPGGEPGIGAVVAKPAWGRGGGGSASPRAARIVGPEPPDEIEVVEEGVRFGIEPLAAENPGLFLDGRRARRWIRSNAAGARVVDLFAHHGSLGVAAAAGGAASVVHVETQRRKLGRIRRNHERNGSRIDDRDLCREDVYRFLGAAASRGASFDLVLLDPPPILPRRGAGPRRRAQDWAALLPKALAVTAPGGRVLAMLHRIDRGRRADPADLVAIAEAAGHRVRIVAEETSGLDFPEATPGAKLAVVVLERAP